MPLTVAETVTAMTLWRERADALLDAPEPVEHERSLSVSKTLDGRRELRGSVDELGGEVIEAALRLATTKNSATEARTAKQRRADALIDVCRHFLDNQQTRPAGRHRPHLNVVVDLVHIDKGGQFISGTIAPGSLIETLLCDCNLHRVLAKGRSGILDYGRSARTAPPDLFNALALRDGQCREPGCDRPPDWCEAHHVHVWEEGGQTSLALIITGPSSRTYISYPAGPLATRQLWAS